MGPHQWPVGSSERGSIADHRCRNNPELLVEIITDKPAVGPGARTRDTVPETLAILHIAIHVDQAQSLRVENFSELRRQRPQGWS